MCNMFGGHGERVGSLRGGEGVWACISPGLHAQMAVA